MVARFALVAGALVLAGCGATGGQPQEIPLNHPASSKAPEAPFTPPENVLGGGIPATEGQKVESKPQAPIPLNAPIKVDVSDDTRKALDQLLKGYEQMRALLAADKLEGIAESASDVATAATKAGDSSPEALRPDLKAAVETAEKLKHAAHIGLEGTRRWFGDLSRSVVRIVASVPPLGQDRKVFKCLMWTKGYNKWIQSGPNISNPYQGAEMLDCGSASDWKE